jgi:hypothetical protein
MSSLRSRNTVWRMRVVERGHADATRAEEREVAHPYAPAVVLDQEVDCRNRCRRARTR